MGAVDYVVVGAGITGCGLAYHLSKAGASVAILDRKGICSGATSATHTQIGMHNRMPGIGADLAFYTMRILATLGDELGCETEFRETGNLMLLEDGFDSSWLEERRKQQADAGIRSELWSREELDAREPWLGKRVAMAVLYPQSVRMNSMRICHGYLRGARAHGAQVMAASPATAIRVRNRQVVAVETPEGPIKTQNVIDAAGAWAGLIGEMAGVRVPIRLNKGHVVVTEPVPDIGVKMKGEVILHDSSGRPMGAEETPSSVLEAKYGIRFVFTQTDHGNCLVGRSGEETPDAQDNTSHTDVVRAILRRAVSFMPMLANVASIRTFTGFRPYSPDGLPMLGSSSRVKGFIVAAGHGDKGVGWLCASNLLADHLTGRPTELPMEPFLFSRIESAAESGRVVHH